MNKLGLLALTATLASMTSCSRLTQSAPATAAEKEAQAESNLCRNMTDGKEAIQEFPQVTEATALADVKEANRKIEKAIIDVQKAGSRVNNPGVMEVQSAYVELKNSVMEIPGGRETVGEAAEGIRADAEELQSEWDSLYSSLQCGA